MTDDRQREVQARIERILDEQIESATTVEGIWLLYQVSAIPRAAGDVQVSECRRAFYAGAAALLELVVRSWNPEVPDVVGELMIEQLRVELAHFARDLQAGHV
jgi:hypothetical protein